MVIAAVPTRKNGTQIHLDRLAAAVTAENAVDVSVVGVE